MSKEPEIRAAMALVWRNLPQGPSTFNPCVRPGCTGSGRGVGPCLACAEKDLGALVGPELAASYVSAIEQVRSIEAQMIDLR